MEEIKTKKCRVCGEEKELDAFVKERHYPSKSEFIRQLIIEKMEL